MEDYSTVEELEQAFSKKTSMLYDCLELRSIDEDTVNKIKSLEANRFQLELLFMKINEKLKDGEENLSQLQGLWKKIENLNKRLDHMDENFPSELNKSKVVKKEECNNLKSMNCNGSGKMNTIPKVQHLTEEEFKKIPKYMKGTMTLPVINKFIDDFNKTIDAKYKLLSTSRKKMKPSEHKIYNDLKMQENADTKGTFFCTDDNLKDYGNIKLSKTIANCLVVLRHSSRTKEIRGTGVTRYAIVS